MVFSFQLQCSGAKFMADNLDSGVNIRGSDNSADNHKLRA